MLFVRVYPPDCHVFYTVLTHDGTNHKSHETFFFSMKGQRQNLGDGARVREESLPELGIFRARWQRGHGSGAA